MKINLVQERGISDLEVTIKYSDYNIEVKNLINILNEASKLNSKVACEKDEKIFFIEKDDIYVIYTEDGFVCAKTFDEVYKLSLRLYEVEQIFSKSFVRVSKSSIVNVNKVNSLEMEFNGKMKLYFDNGIEYTSRSYLSDIKKALGLGRKI